VWTVEAPPAAAAPTAPAATPARAPRSRPAVSRHNSASGISGSSGCGANESQEHSRGYCDILHECQLTNSFRRQWHFPQGSALSWSKHFFAAWMTTRATPTKWRRRGFQNLSNGHGKLPTEAWTLSIGKKYAQTQSPDVVTGSDSPIPPASSGRIRPINRLQLSPPCLRLNHIIPRLAIHTPRIDNELRIGSDHLVINP
jgi:hypothetical protein